MSWTSEKVEKLKELWSKGHTASQIAENLEIPLVTRLLVKRID